MQNTKRKYNHRHYFIRSRACLFVSQIYLLSREIFNTQHSPTWALFFFLYLLPTKGDNQKPTKLILNKLYIYWNGNFILVLSTNRQVPVGSRGSLASKCQLLCLDKRTGIHRRNTPDLHMISSCNKTEIISNNTSIATPHK